MKREEKLQIIEKITGKLDENTNFYLTDISELDASDTSALRRACFKSDIELVVVKNTLLEKAFGKSQKEVGELTSTLKGNTALMFCETGNAPAKLIKNFRKDHDKPVLKGAFIAEAIYVGDNQIETLTNIKSKEEVIADIVLLLQSPVKNVVSSLQSGANILTGVLETLAKKEE